MDCIRPAIPTDALGISTVQVSTWLEAYAGLMPEEYLKEQSVEGRLARWSEILRSDGVGNARTWVATRSDDIVGFVSSGPCRDAVQPPGLRWEVYALYVKASYWGQGLGTSLLTAALKRVPPEAESVSLWVLAGNQRAIRFYASRGFVHDGTEKEAMRSGHAFREQRFVRPMGFG